jgi:RNA polymerase sigma-70 factor (ECF subfamily)
MNNPDQSEQFLAMIDAHKGIIYKVAHSYCQDADDRKDLVQEITIQLWRSFERYNEQYQYTTWVYRIALNVAISFYRKEHRRKQVAQPFSDDILSVSACYPEANENLTCLMSLIAELREIDKALMLLYLDEKSYREIADIMGMTETNVATKIGRIKNLLKQKFLTLNS